MSFANATAINSAALAHNKLVCGMEMNGAIAFI